MWLQLDVFPAEDGIKILDMEGFHFGIGSPGHIIGPSEASKAVISFRKKLRANLFSGKCESWSIYIAHGVQYMDSFVYNAHIVDYQKQLVYYIYKNMTWIRQVVSQIFVLILPHHPSPFLHLALLM